MKLQKRKKETDTGFSGTGEAYDMGVNKDGVRARPSDFPLSTIIVFGIR